MAPRTKASLVIGVVAAAALALSGCGTSGGSGSPASAQPAKTEIGAGEGQLSILGWPGYVEDGSNDPAVDWVHPFEQQTGCKVSFKPFGTSDEAVTLMRTGQYDVISASGDASLRLVAGHDVQPVNMSLLKNYPDIYPFLKDKAWNTVNGVNYGMPHGWGANLLMYSTNKVTPAPTSWSAVFDDAAKHTGKVTAYDSPIYIADAAMYLMAHKPELGIKNPYALDKDQLAAAVDLLKQQRTHIGEYWSDVVKEVQAFTSGSTVVGTTWQVGANIAASDGAKVATLVPKEGATGWSDTWMLSAKAKHPNCAYAWFNWIVSPKVNAQVAEYFGEAPANRLACAHTASPTFCADYHAGDSAYYKRVWFWTTPIPQCLDGRKDATCVPYAKWVQAWTSLKG
jgi:putative spermidine/putrescine transport system substrate-binding protein